MYPKSTMQIEKVANAPRAQVTWFMKSEEEVALLSLLRTFRDLEEDESA